MKSYRDLLSEAMLLASSYDEVIFCGQAVAYEGTAMRNTLIGIPQARLIEFPVDEDFQMGFCNGLALTSCVPVCIFPRWNFLLLATNQIVNYLDKLEELTECGVNSKVIIRTAVGSENPLHPGVQHVGDYTNAFRLLVKNINIVNLDKKEMILNEYKKALDPSYKKSSILIEHSDLYDS